MSYYECTPEERRALRHSRQHDPPVLRHREPRRPDRRSGAGAWSELMPPRRPCATIDSRPMQFRTRAIHVGNEPDPQTGAVVPPIPPGDARSCSPAPASGAEFDYSRSGNPTRKAFETTLASLEGGFGALAFASGMAATHCVTMLLEQRRSRRGRRRYLRRHLSAAAQDRQPRRHRRLAGSTRPT